MLSKVLVFNCTARMYQLSRNFLITTILKLELISFRILWIQLLEYCGFKLYPDVWRVRKNFQQTNFTMPTNMSSMKYALKSVPGLADIGVPHGDELISGFLAS